jgi:hypothetical protein
MLVRHKSRRAGERGQTMALVAISMVSLLAMAALAIDVVTLYSARGQAERAADAAALSAAKVLADSGVTTDPGNISNPSIWAAACTAAVTEATNVANQNLIAGQTPNSVTVTFPAFGASTCSGTNSTFGINPQVQVQVSVTSVPTFFAKIWSKASTLVSATALAEAYNPSNSSSIPTTGGIIGPNLARCVKPMLVPNCDPDNAGGAGGCNGGSGGFATFVAPSNGSITTPGSVTTGVVGETFYLSSACTGGTSPCLLQRPSSVMPGTGPNRLAYYPLSLASTVPTICPGGALCSPTTDYEKGIACCNWTPLQCGQPYSLDTNEISLGGSTGQTQSAGQCLIHEVAAGGSPTPPDCSPSLDQDCLETSSGGVAANPPYVMTAGTKNPLISKTTGPGVSLAAGDAITVSDSVVTLPIYDNTVPAGGNNFPPSTVTVIGFLQAFINDAAPTNGTDMQVTVLNVTGCGSNPTGPGVAGAGPAIPVRLIHN